jgi:hypothetical protein
VALGLFGQFCQFGEPRNRALADETVADREAALLHRRLDLAVVQKWSRSMGSWQPLSVPPSAVYVVNLWSIHCKPCLAEFPLLKNILAGWKSRSEVQFLFIADPPSETSEAETVAFWQQSRAALPDADPCRASSDELRRSLENDSEPLTLLLDDRFVIRQAFIGSIGSRPLGRSIERLLRSAKNGSLGSLGSRRGRISLSLRESESRPPTNRSNR